MTATTPGATLHPRPQLQRERWISLDGPWRFAFDSDCCWHRPADIQDWPLTIRVPFCPESRMSGIGDTGFHPVCWYERDFDLPELPPNGRLLLHFGAVDYHARVWIDGHPVTEHEGGHTFFSADITAARGAAEEIEIVVRVEDDPFDLTKPRGKQDWQAEPHEIWYPRTSGIWQTVWLEPVPPLRIERVRWIPHLER